MDSLSTEPLSTSEKAEPEPYSEVSFKLPSDIKSTVLGLAEIADQLSVTDPGKAKELKRDIIRMIRESVEVEIT